MPNPYKTQFNRLILVEKQTFQTACKEVFLQYLADLPRGSTRSKTAEAPVRIEIENLIKHIEKAEIGEVLVNYEFISPISKELTEFIQIAKQKETVLFNMPSEFVADCENKAAAQGNSAQAIYEQLARLEVALQANMIPSCYLNEVNEKVFIWSLLLYEKFALLILEAKNIETLKQKIDQSFLQTLAVNTDFHVSIFRDEVDCQVEFLEEKKFFEKFYALSDLAGKYEFAYEFYQNLKESGRMTQELRATLLHLFYLIINKAYAPCEVKKFNLMRDEGATIEVVFTALKEWAAARWKKYDSDDFVGKLHEKLLEQEQHYRAWNEISVREDLAQGPKEKSMVELYCFKYSTGDPTLDPVKALQMLPSPQKPKNKRAVDDIQSGEVSDTCKTISLKSNEVLDLFDDEKENIDQKRLKTS